MVLDIVQGSFIKFDSKPTQSYIPTSYSREKYCEAMDREIDQFLKLKIIEKCQKKGGFVSRIFPHAKSDGKIRMLLDLTELNNFVDC